MNETNFEKIAIENVERIMSKLDFVSWDRFTCGRMWEGEPHTDEINLYGWIDRAEGQYKDFVLVKFDMYEGCPLSYFTSSAKKSVEIGRLLGLCESEHHHNECIRAETIFDTENIIKLGN